MSFIAKIKTYIRFKLWAKVRINFFPSYYSSHSQFGEDMIVRSLVNDKKNGFYVDIGAHHPVYYSNTYHFYQKGWSGVNIDAAPGSMDLFKSLRCRDKNLEICIGPNRDQEIEFFVFDQPALNTFEPEMAARAQQTSKLLGTHKIKTKTLEQTLSEVVPENQEIDFLSIDVEGLDEMILRTNNWKKFSPKIIIFESHSTTIENIKIDKLTNYLSEQGYVIVGKAGPSFIAQLVEKK